MTKNDVTTIINAAKELIQANKRRGPGSEIATLNEKYWIDELERAISLAKEAV